MSSLFGLAKGAYDSEQSEEKTKQTKTSAADVIQWAGCKDSQTVSLTSTQFVGPKVSRPPPAAVYRLEGPSFRETANSVSVADRRRVQTRKKQEKRPAQCHSYVRVKIPTHRSQATHQY